MSRRIADLLAWAAGAGLFGYVLIRAATIPCTFDEATTYWREVRSPVVVILSPRRRSAVANNHLLNSLLAKAAAALAGSSVGVLRVPNVLAFVSFAVFAWLVLRRLAPPTIALAGFVAVAGNLFVLDFFSLCRGYGLAIGFLAPGIYLAFSALEDRPGGWIASAGAVLCFSLAMLASFPLLAPLAVVAVGIPGFRMLRDRKRGVGPRDAARKELVPVALILAAALAIGVPYLAALFRSHALYFGGTRGFVSDTVRSLVADSLYGAGAGRRTKLLTAAVVAAWAAATALALWIAKNGEGPAALPYLACAIILGGTIVAAVLAHRFLGSKYLISRTALFLIPLFLFVLFGALGWLARSPNPLRRTAAIAVALAIGGAAALLFASRANLRRPLYWTADMDTPAMLDDLARMRPTREPIRLSVDYNLSSAIRYYCVTGPMPWLSVVSRIPFRPDADYAYLQAHHRADAEAAGFRLIRSYPETGNVLLARR